MNTDKLEAIFREIADERMLQIAKHGPDNDKRNTPNDWLAHIVKHLGRAWTFPFDKRMFHLQMVRVAALAVAAIEWVDNLD